MQEKLRCDGSENLIAKGLLRAAYQVITCQKYFISDFSFLINFITNPFIVKICFRISLHVDFKAYMQMKVSFPILCLRPKQAYVGSANRIIK